MKLKEIAINTTYRHPLSIMNKYAWCVQEHYWSYLKQYNTGQYQKVIIRVDDDKKWVNNDGELDKSYVDVAVINKYFDISTFLNLNKIDKKRTLLELLHNSMLVLAGHYGWEKDPLNNAYCQCVDDNLEYKFKVKNKNFESPTKEFIGYAQCDWDIDSFSAFGVVLRKDGFLLKQDLLMEVEPYHGEFIYYSSCRWDDPYTFSLYSKEGKRWSTAILSIV